PDASEPGGRNPAGLAGERASPGRGLAVRVNRPEGRPRAQRSTTSPGLRGLRIQAAPPAPGTRTPVRSYLAPTVSRPLGMPVLESMTTPSVPPPLPLTRMVSPTAVTVTLTTRTRSASSAPPLALAAVGTLTSTAAGVPTDPSVTT